MWHNTVNRIRNTLDINSKRLIYYSLIHPYLDKCTKEISVWVHYLRLKNNRIRGIFPWIKKKIIWIKWLNNKKEYLPIKWLMAHTCLAAFSLTDMNYIITNIDILTDRHELHHYQLRHSHWQTWITSLPT